MREIISEIVRHTGGLGFIEIVKITGTEEGTLIEAMDNDKTVIIKGELHNPLPEFEGEFGMSNLSLIKGLVDHPSFKTDEATVEVERQGDAPSEIKFTDEQGQEATYRFMNSQLVPNQAKFLGAEWDIEVHPTKSKIAEFASFAGLYNFENLFMVDTKGSQLRFHIGDPSSASHKAMVIFSKDTGGKMSAGLYWPVPQVLSILKLAEDEKSEMHFSSKGALQISIEGTFANWKYILPAKKR